MENNELSIAYAEVYEILSFMEPKYIDKIPLKLMELFREEKLKDYKPNIEPTIPLDEQKLQKKTLIILAMLNINYWCEDEKEKNELRKIYEDNESAINESIQVEFVDDMFKNHKNNNENVSDKVSSDVKNEKKVNQTINPNISKSVNIVVYKEPNIFKKCLSKIKKLFK